MGMLGADIMAPWGAGSERFRDGQGFQGSGLADDACANSGCRTSGHRMGRRIRNSVGYRQ